VSALGVGVWVVEGREEQVAHQRSAAEGADDKPQARCAVIDVVRVDGSDHRNQGLSMEFAIVATRTVQEAENAMARSAVGVSCCAA
jgi:hypothetical protein